MTASDSESIRMSLGDHLDDLRRRLILGFIGPVIGAVVVLFFGRSLVAYLCRPLELAQARMGLAPQVYSLSVLEAFSVYLKVSLLGGLILGMPWLLWHLWQFVAAGLYRHERRFVVLLIPGSATLTVVGLLFMYYVMLPVVLAFLIGFSVSFPASPSVEGGWFNWIYDRLIAPVETVSAPTPPPEHALQVPTLWQDPPVPAESQLWLKMPEQQLRLHVNGQVFAFLPQESGIIAPMFRLNDYIGFVARLALAFAITFQMPLVMVLLAQLGIVDAQQMSRIRRYMLLVCFVTGAALTPADPMSQFLLAVPMYLLYELGLLLARRLGRPSSESA
jgi:Sec-independent protein secretion pathway component TatC